VGLFSDEVRFGVGYTDDIAVHLQDAAVDESGRATVGDPPPFRSSSSSKGASRFWSSPTETTPVPRIRVERRSPTLSRPPSSPRSRFAGFQRMGSEGSESVNVRSHRPPRRPGQAVLPKKVEEVKKAFAEVQQDSIAITGWPMLRELRLSGRVADIRVTVKKPPVRPHATGLLHRPPSD
jgi:hypothetical protein